MFQRGDTVQSNYMRAHLSTLYRQREEMLHRLRTSSHEVWARPLPEKWSYGETYYHLYLMIKRFRQLNRFYLPIAKSIAKFYQHKSYLTSSPNIYIEYRDKHKGAMKAPSIIVPPKDVQYKISFEALLHAIADETRKLENLIYDISDDIAGHIRYPDPVAHHPNLIQSIHLLAIHEQHHYQLCLKYYADGFKD